MQETLKILEWPLVTQHNGCVSLNNVRGVSCDFPAYALNSFTFRRPTKKGSQPLPRMKREDPTVLLWTGRKAANARQGDTFTGFEIVVQRLNKAIDPGRYCRFIG